MAFDPSIAMRGLTLWQPWASGMAFTLKANETRSWPTKYRGPLAIHAAMRKVRPEEMPTDEWEALAGAMNSYSVGSGIEALGKLPRGAIVCVVEVIDCVPTESIRDRLSPRERAWGNYQDGRWAWVTRFLHRFEKPIERMGEQGLWRVAAGDLGPVRWPLPGSSDGAP